MATGGESTSSLTPFDFPGRYGDGLSSEEITWKVRPTARRVPPGQSGFELRTTIRGVEHWGYDFDGLSADDTDAARAAGLPIDLYQRGAPAWTLQGDLPCTLDRDGLMVESVIHFLLELDPSRREENLLLRTVVDGTTIAASAGWFEDAIPALEAQLSKGTTFVCCYTCLFSDYSPAGHGLLGMACHRGSKEQYLAVRSKWDYFKVPRTEEVMETHLCPEYARRVPGTGYLCIPQDPGGVGRPAAH